MTNFSRAGASLAGALRAICCFATGGFALVACVSVGAYAAPFDESVQRYRALVAADIDQALAGARRLHDCIAVDNLDCAKRAWVAARGGWERSEVFTGGLVPELDEKIDAWPKTTAGFHAIEARLFGAAQTNVASETDALIADLAELDAKIRDMPLPPQDLLNGAARLAYEVGESKADGGESRLSGTSLDDMRNNVLGIQQAYHTIFGPLLAASDQTLAETAESQIETLHGLLHGPSLASVDSDKLRKATEEFVLTLASAAPKIGLEKPVLEDVSK